MNTYGIGCDGPEKGTYYVVVNGFRLARIFPSNEAALAYVDSHKAECRDQEPQWPGYGQAMRIIRGDRLTQKQTAQVLAAYVHRHDAIGDGKAYPNEQAWLCDHAFYFIKDGSRLASNRKFCEPAFLAEGV